MLLVTIILYFQIVKYNLYDYTIFSILVKTEYVQLDNSLNININKINVILILILKYHNTV